MTSTTLGVAVSILGVDSSYHSLYAVSKYIEISVCLSECVSS